MFAVCVCVCVCVLEVLFVLVSQLLPIRGGVLSILADSVVFIKGAQGHKSIFDFSFNLHI